MSRGTHRIEFAIAHLTPNSGKDPGENIILTDMVFRGLKWAKANSSRATALAERKLSLKGIDDFVKPFQQEMRAAMRNAGDIDSKGNVVLLQVHDAFLEAAEDIALTTFKQGPNHLVRSVLTHRAANYAQRAASFLTGASLPPFRNG